MKSIRIALALTFTGSTLRAAVIFSPSGFTLPVTVIDYSNSPVGFIPQGTSITNQYASIGVIHDGNTTTPPGPDGMSSASGLPALESSSFDPDGNLPISITFTAPVHQCGAFFLMGSAFDSLTVTAFRQDNSVIETTTLAADSMTTSPFGYHEGFIGLLASENIDHITFAPLSVAFVIDDLYYAAVPEASQTLLGLTGAFALFSNRRRGKQVAVGAS